MRTVWLFKNYTLRRYQYILQRTLFDIDKACIILDAGCGHNGSIEGQLHSTCKVIGVDVNRKLLGKAKGRGLNVEDYVAASLCFLPFKTNTFNVVLSQDVLEHVKDKTKAMQEMSRVTRERGVLLGSTTNLINPVMLFDSLALKCVIQPLILKYSGIYVSERHLRFTPFKLENLLKAFFEQNRIQFVGAPPFHSSRYHSKLRLPWFVEAWIFFDKLTAHGVLKVFKEMMVFEAVK